MRRAELDWQPNKSPWAGQPAPLEKRYGLALDRSDMSVAIHPQSASLYSDLVACLVAAAQGRLSKRLVPDLEETLGGDVIGDEELTGIRLGDGSVRDEADLTRQDYALDFARRGIELRTQTIAENGSDRMSHKLGTIELASLVVQKLNNKAQQRL